MPELETSQGATSSLMAHNGGLLGVRDRTRTGGNINRSIDPKVVERVQYLTQLMYTPISFAAYDTTVTPYYFFREMHNPSVLGYIKRYTIGLPGVIIRLFNSEESVQEPQGLQAVKEDTVLNLTRAQWRVVKQLRERINVEIDQQSGLATLTATMPEPDAAAELAEAGIGILVKRVKKYRTQKA